MRSSAVPSDPLGRFTAIYERLHEGHDWFGDASSLRFAAVAAITSPGSPEDVAGKIRSAAAAIRERSGWFGDLNNQLRFVASALLVQSGDDPRSFLEEADRVHGMFRHQGLRRGGVYETMAILVLRMRENGAEIPEAAVERFAQVYRQMKTHHWWLTGPHDFPACAILVDVEGTPDEIGARVEDIYGALHDTGLSRGDHLQTAAHILYLARRPAAEIARRYAKLVEVFASRGVEILQSEYDEMAILSFLDVPPDRVADAVLECRSTMEQLAPRPDDSMTFNLASGVAFLRFLGDGDDDVDRTDESPDVQTVIDAQQAAATIAACTAAVTSSSDH